MPPENRSADEVPEIPVKEDEWNGPWGSISPAPNSIETLCIQIEPEAGKPRVYFFPYRTIGRWSWTMDQPETLEIYAAGVQITISGTGLRRLAEALNTGQLRLMQTSTIPIMNGETSIKAVVFDDSQS